MYTHHEHSLSGTSAPVKQKFFRQDFLAVIPAAFFIVTAIAGAVNWFSSVPFWDMWDGTVYFWIELHSRGIWTLFERANEHRVVWSRMLFWADYRFFGGLNYLLIAVNVVLMMSLWIALAQAAKRLAGDNRRAAFLASMLIAIPCFSWLQAENITWGYQSQFFLAYLLPLLAFMCMARWMRDGREAWYVGAVLLGIASAFSMANGLLSLPLLIVMMLVNRRLAWLRLATLTVITGVTIALWFRDYAVPPHVAAKASEKVKLILTFLGAPGHFLFQSEILGFALGCAVIASAGYFVIAWITGKTRDPLFSGLVLFVLYVCAAAMAVAQGRPFDDYHMTLTGRYETPVMLAYAAIALLYVHLNRHRKGTTASLATLICTVTVIFIQMQVTAVGPGGAIQADQRMQALEALNLGVRDTSVTKWVYPADEADQVTNVLRKAQEARDADLGLFARDDLKAARMSLGKTPQAAGLEACSGHLDVTQLVATDSKFQRVFGWAFNEKTQTVPPVAFMVANGIVTGAALTGRSRPDVERQFPKAMQAGFRGYAQTIPFDPQIYCSKVETNG